MIRGGDWPSTVAGECLTHFRLALFPGERVADLEQRVELTVASIARDHPALAAHRFEVPYDGFRCEGYELEPGAPLVTGLLDAAGAGDGPAPARPLRSRRRCRASPSRRTRPSRR